MVISPRRPLLALFAWQILSLLLTVTGICSQRLAALGVDAPTAQSAAVYLLLSLHWLVILLRRPTIAAGRAPRTLPWWQWLAIAAADVEANFLVVKVGARLPCSDCSTAMLSVDDGRAHAAQAYQFTDICSVTILDAFTVPTVMLLSAGCVGVRYSAIQCGAAALCLGGIVALFASDMSASDTNFPHAWLGDVLVLAGAALYGISNVAQEHLVRSLEDRHVYLAHLGSYGAAIAIVQSALLERSAISAAWHTATDTDSSSSGRGGGLGELIGLEAGFVGALLAFYVGVAALLSWGSSATTMNLSLLTSDFWSVAAGVTLLHSRPGLIYAVAFALVVLGLVLYHADPKLTRLVLGRGRGRGSSGGWRSSLRTGDEPLVTCDDAEASLADPGTRDGRMPPR